MFLFRCLGFLRLLAPAPLIQDACLELLMDGDDEEAVGIFSAAPAGDELLLKVFCGDEAIRQLPM